MFEVQDLRYATLATVSRCGMVWFSEDIVSTEMVFSNYLTELKTKPIEEFEEDIGLRRQTKKGEENVLSPAMQVLDLGQKIHFHKMKQQN
jgi:dynein heavy chain 1